MASGSAAESPVRRPGPELGPEAWTAGTGGQVRSRSAGRVRRLGPTVGSDRGPRVGSAGWVRGLGSEVEGGSLGSEPGPEGGFGSRGPEAEAEAESGSGDRSQSHIHRPGRRSSWRPGARTRLEAATGRKAWYPSPSGPVRTLTALPAAERTPSPAGRTTSSKRTDGPYLHTGSGPVAGRPSARSMMGVRGDGLVTLRQYTGRTRSPASRSGTWSTAGSRSPTPEGRPGSRSRLSTPRR